MTLFLNGRMEVKIDRCNLSIKEIFGIMPHFIIKKLGWVGQILRLNDKDIIIKNLN